MPNYLVEFKGDIERVPASLLNQLNGTETLIPKEARSAFNFMYQFVLDNEQLITNDLITNTYLKWHTETGVLSYTAKVGTKANFELVCDPYRITIRQYYISTIIVPYPWKDCPFTQIPDIGHKASTLYGFTDALTTTKNMPWINEWEAQLSPINMMRLSDNLEKQKRLRDRDLDWL